MITFERDGPRPIDILQRFIQTDPEFTRAAEERGSLVRLPVAKPLGDLVRPVAEEDPNELLKHRFLSKGGAALLVGPTGVGKSSLSMQAAICWAANLPCFGLVPTRALRILIVQAENDEGDMAEMRDGVLAGLKLTAEQRALALANVRIVTEDTKTREGFANLLDRLLDGGGYDLVKVDPAFAYVGGDASSQRDVSPFLRNMLNPVIHRHNVGLILVHHANKPPQGEQKGQWQAGDFAYLGAGSAEFANWARAVIALRSIGSDSVFQLMLAKRGRRARWVDANGQPTTSRYIAYDRQPGVICWREPSREEVLPFLPPDKALSIQDLVDLIGAGTNAQAEVVASLEKSKGVRKSTVYNLIVQAVAAKVIRKTGPKNNQTLVLTGKVAAQTPVEDAGDER